MIEVGLWVKTDQEEIVIKRDTGGHPDLAPLSDPRPFADREAKKEKIRSFYRQLTGRPHPHPHAATRQLLWDFIEVALKRLP